MATFFHPTWAQNGTKMSPRWPFGGSWVFLGGKMAPRWSQEGSKVEKVNSFPPCWGPSWGPILDILITRVFHKRLEDPVGLHVVSRHPCLGERGSLGTHLNPSKCSSRYNAVHILHISAVCLLDGSWVRTWTHLESVLGAKLGHVGHQVGLQWLFNITPKIGW